MIETSRISSGFDVELQLGSRWFFTALNLMNDHGLLTPLGYPITIDAVRIILDPNWDLEIDIHGLGTINASVSISDDGTEFIINTNISEIPESRIPFSAFEDLPQTPVLVTLGGDSEHESVIAVLANLILQAGSQQDEPLPEGEFLPRGNADNAQSFLPLGKEIAFGMCKDTFSRLANNIWHTDLRASDGTHPFPDEENKRGKWTKVIMEPKNGKISLKLKGYIPVDSPIIDIVPDPDITITLLITPALNNGGLIFKVETDTDVDTGLLGDLFGGVVGGFVFFVLGLFTCGLFLVGVGAAVGIIAIEVTESVVEGKVRKEIKAKIDGEDIPSVYCSKDGIVQIAQKSKEGFNLSFVDAIPSSITIHAENPVNEFLYKKILLVTSIYSDFTVNSHGFGVAGSTGTAEKSQPEIVTLDNALYQGEKLTSLTYMRTNGQQQTIAIREVFARCMEAELKAPFKISQEPEDAILRIPEGRLACVCLNPLKIHRKNTVVEEIRFENRIKLKVSDAIALQDAAAIVVMGYQLIHPRGYNAYYRAKADYNMDNNFENLPKF